jgi:hypothetical protein
MFAILNAGSSSTNTIPINWAAPQHIQVHSSTTVSSDAAATAPQQPLLSVLDALAAPTVFMQQALVFKKALSAADLAAAVQLVLEGYPALGYRLTTDQVRPAGDF